MLPALLLGIAQSSDRDVLVAGVGSLSAPGALPGAMVASGKAFVVLQSEGKPVFVAARVGGGRALAGGHGAFFGAGPLGTPANDRFLMNALVWLAPRAKGIKVGMLGADLPKAWLAKNGMGALPLRRERLAAGLLGVDVVMLGQGELTGDDAAQKTLVEWTKRGHGLLVTGPAWGWLQLDPGGDILRDYAPNRMLLPFGIGASEETADGAPSPTGADDPLLQTESALAALGKGEGTKRATATVARAMALVPPGGALVETIRAKAAAEAPLGTLPLTEAMPYSRLNAVVAAREWRGIDPSAKDFPGAVPPEAKRVTRVVPVDTKVTQWHATGLYAAPGETVTISLPAGTEGKGLGVRIGSHTDTLYHTARWDRAPEISRRWTLNAATTTVASPFGGTVFIDVPERSTLGNIDVKVSGAVPAPHFVRDVTTKAEWARQMAQPGGPWVELEGRTVALSVPRSACESLKDPGALMAFWDETFEACRTLYAAPARSRPERYCVDRQISAGYMHSGYPIMTFEDVAKTFTDVDKLRGKGKSWGFFHELGHNFQQDAWTFDGTGEVTNNLFSLYGSEKLNGITPAEYGVAHPAMKPAEQRKRLEGYLAAGAPFDKWKSDPFLALTMDAQIREAFGWEPFTKVFGQYRTEKLDPKSEIAQHDEWMKRLSRATGRNLGPFFVAWGVPTTEAARQTLADLPKWMPADWPAQR